ncbi:DUF4230 domain-containing protein [bacterium]|nr:DUF4230 domain-containing protein [bacterium]
MKKILLATAILSFSYNSHAFTWPWNIETKEETTSAIATTIKNKGNKENKVITYEINQIDKKTIDQTIVAEQTDKLSQLTAYIKNTLGGYEAEAQFSTKVLIGFDAKNFTEKNISVDDSNKKIKVSLPDIKVQYIDIDYSNSYIITKKQGVISSSRERDELLNELFSKYRDDIIKASSKNEMAMHEARLNAFEIIKESIEKEKGIEYSIEMER